MSGITSEDALTSVMNALNGRERRIVALRFGLDGGNPRTLQEIGDELNLTRERIRQLERGVLRKLRHPMAYGSRRDG